MQTIKPKGGLNIVITGANSGIGFQTMKQLFLQGNNIIFGSRNQVKNKEAVSMAIEERKMTKKQLKNTLDSFSLDLSKKASIQNFVKQVKEKFTHIDILINNSGLVLSQYQTNQQGIEMTCLVNHFGHFYLTYLLFDMMKNRPEARIINVSSMLHFQAKKNPFDDLNCQQNSYSSSGQYAISKFMNVVFAFQLSKRMTKYPNIKAFSLHPGIVDSNFGSQVWWVKFFSTCCCCFYVNNATGARTNLHLSTHKFSQLRNGQYYHSDTTFKQMDQRARDPQLREKLWKISQQAYGIKFNI